LKILCAVYKSLKRADTYIYVPKKDDFSAIPEPLLERFGAKKLVMQIPLPSTKKLVGVEESKLLAAFEEHGFYLQLPPSTPSLLAQHRAELGLSPDPEQDR
jgi:uncharacterized protein YcgL (UPF0745 family)